MSSYPSSKFVKDLLFFSAGDIDRTQAACMLSASEQNRAPVIPPGSDSRFVKTITEHLDDSASSRVKQGVQPA
ncbi:hypothetical protein RRG08_059342 [Elysia crispata]|uniref:Uncharacterized protein n=1 Tax=Elysia crispata TaxID=231223 RepID=A0AAE1BGN9_9GAST|nr:hypothetical protein RRG08_059342 [Elysia crispata]